MTKLTFNLFFLFLLTFAFACGSTEETVTSQSALSDASVATTVASEEGRATIAVMGSTSILSDWVKNVGGDRVEVKSVVPEGVDPHSYKLGAKDISVISDSDIVFVVGLGYEESWLAKLLSNDEDINLVELGNFITPVKSSNEHQHHGHGHGDEHDEDEEHDEHEKHDEDEEHDEHDEDEEHEEHDEHEKHDEDEEHDEHDEDEEHDEHEKHDEDEEHDEHDEDEEHDEHDDHDSEKKYDDPHFWFDPSRVVILIDVIASELSALDAASSDYYNQNANVYKEKVSEMDSYVTTEFGKVKGRAFMTTHDSLAYLEDKYPVSIVGSIIPTLQDSDQLNPGDLVEAIETVKENSVKAIFVADTVSDRFAQAVAEETGVKVVTGLNVEGLVGENDTYIEFMKRNASVIVGALSD